jgi:hypothetical protein
MNHTIPSHFSSSLSLFLCLFVWSHVNVMTLCLSPPLNLLYLSNSIFMSLLLRFK